MIPLKCGEESVIVAGGTYFSPSFPLFGSLEVSKEHSFKVDSYCKLHSSTKISEGKDKNSGSVSPHEHV